MGKHVERPLLRLHADLTQPAARPVQWLEHAASVLVGDEEQHALALAEMRFDVGPEVAVHDVRQLLRSLELDSELAADQARGPVGRQQRPTGERLGRSRGPRPNLERGALVTRAPARRSFVASVANRTSTIPVARTASSRIASMSSWDDMTGHAGLTSGPGPSKTI